MFKRTKPAVITLMLLTHSIAMAGPTLPTGGGSAFATGRTWLQNFIDFMTGPFGTAAIILSLVVGFAAWTMAPKEGIVGTIVRAVTSGIVIFNISVWLGTFGAGS